MKTTYTSDKSEDIKKCFLKKLKEFEKLHLRTLKEKGVVLSDLYFLYNSENFIKYEFRISLKKLDSSFQKEAELFFSSALKGCLDKYS
tara:strand:+ start:602 stop:865 length:264 start_codon:yes stop_codon:yes gene_type:complete